MAITEVVQKEAAQMRLNIGLDASGNIKTASVSLGTLSSNTGDWDAQKAYNIARALKNCMTKPLYEVLHVQTTSLVSSA